MPRLYDRVIMFRLLAERHFLTEEVRHTFLREDIRTTLGCRNDADDFVPDHPTRAHAIIPFTIRPTPGGADFRADPKGSIGRKRQASHIINRQSPAPARQVPPFS